MIKSYFAFSGWFYRLMTCVMLPIFIIAVHILLLNRWDMDASPFLLIGWSVLDVIMDGWFLGGIHAKDCQGLDYLKTSRIGMESFRNTLIGDVVRRLLTAVILAYVLCLFAGDAIVNLLTIALGCFAFAQAGIFVTRFSGFFSISVAIEYGMAVIETLVILLVIVFWNVTAGIVLFAILSVVFAVLSVKMAMRRMEGGFYDGRC